MTDTNTEPDRDGAEMGTGRHAELLTEGRHPAIRDNLQWLTYSHLPPHLRVLSEPFYAAAVDLVLAVPTDSPELTDSLKLLVQAKDSGVRAGIKHQQGKAGSVPRPQTVVDPPRLTQAGYAEQHRTQADAAAVDATQADAARLTGPDQDRKTATERAFGQAD